VIPDLVRDEYRVKMTVGDPDLVDIPWLTIKPTRPDTALHAYRALGGGEAAAITLAQSHQARLLILDDKYARDVARRLGLPVVGTLGVLLAAKQIGALAAIQPVLDALIAQGRRISPKLRTEVLRAAGEG
jgi:predicted nucleic acid-binding protein